MNSSKQVLSSRWLHKMYYNYIIMRIYKLNFAFNKSLKYLYKYHYYYLLLFFILLIINLRMLNNDFIRLQYQF